MVVCWVGIRGGGVDPNIILLTWHGILYMCSASSLSCLYNIKHCLWRLVLFGGMFFLYTPVHYHVMGINEWPIQSINILINHSTLILFNPLAIPF